MNKSELIEALSLALEIPARTAGSILETMLEAMMETMVRGDNIEIRGFGSFSVKTYKPYTGRNPKTGEQIKVSPKKLPFFKVGKELKERVDC
jgi:integration host factor subunit beta